MAKEKARIVKETKSTVLWEVPAYSNSELVGWAKVTTFKETGANLDAVKAALQLGDVIDLNRQRFTDGKNNLRRGVSKAAALKKLAKENPKVDQIITLILKKAEAGELTDDFLKSIGA